MSKTQIPIVVNCKDCGDPVVIESVETMRPDPQGEMLFELTKQISKAALCPWCDARHKREREKENVR